MWFLMARRAGLATIAASVLASAAWAGVESDEGLPDTLLSEPAVTGLINDGDESVVETVYVYLDGCPILSITPPPSGQGDPEVTILKTEGECVAADSSGTTLEYLSAMGLGIEEGMHVKLQRDAAEDPAQGDTALIVDIANLYPKAQVRNGHRPRFWIPGVFGDPSGNLVVASANGNSDGGDGGSGSGSGGGITPAGLFGGPGGGFGGAGGNGGGGGGGNGGGTFAGPGGGPGGGGFGPGVPPGSNPPADTTPIPLPASLLLLLGALVWLRSFVYRGRL